MLKTTKGIRRWTVPALLVVALATAACNFSPNALIGHEKVGGGIATDLEIANPSLQEKIVLGGPAEVRRVGDLLLVNAELRNTSKKTIWLEYRFQWFAPDGLEIPDAKSHWMPAAILGRSDLQVQEVAPTHEVTTFKLMVRKSEPIEP
jgi:uncharacterized protein YcfL